MNSIRRGPALLAMLLAVLVSPAAHAELERVRFGAKKQAINDIRRLQQSIDKLAQQGWTRQIARTVAAVHRGIDAWIPQFGGWRKAKIFFDPNPTLWNGNHISAEWKRGRVVLEAHQVVEKEGNDRSHYVELHLSTPAALDLKTSLAYKTLAEGGWSAGVETRHVDYRALVKLMEQGKAPQSLEELPSMPTITLGERAYWTGLKSKAPQLKRSVTVERDIELPRQRTTAFALPPSLELPTVGENLAQHQAELVQQIRTVLEQHGTEPLAKRAKSLFRRMEGVTRNLGEPVLAEGRNDRWVHEVVARFKDGSEFRTARGRRADRALTLRWVPAPLLWLPASVAETKEGFGRPTIEVTIWDIDNPASSIGYTSTRSEASSGKTIETRVHQGRDRNQKGTVNVEVETTITEPLAPNFSLADAAFLRQELGLRQQ